MNEEHDLIKEVRQVAGQVHRRWPGIISQDELEQEVWVALLQRPATMKKAESPDAKVRRGTLFTLATQIAKTEYRDKLVFYGDYFYSVDDVKDILEQGDFLENPDIAAGFEALNDRYAKLVWDRYVGLKPPKTGSERTALSRALTRLTDYANRHRDSEYSELTPGNTLDDGPGTKSSQLTRETGY